MKIKEFAKYTLIGMLLAIEIAIIVLAGLQLYDMKLANDYRQALESKEYYYD